MLASINFVRLKYLVWVNYCVIKNNNTIIDLYTFTNCTFFPNVYITSNFLSINQWLLTDKDMVSDYQLTGFRLKFIWLFTWNIQFWQNANFMLDVYILAHKDRSFISPNFWISSDDTKTFCQNIAMALVRNANFVILSCEIVLLLLIVAHFARMFYLF